MGGRNPIKTPDANARLKAGGWLCRSTVCSLSARIKGA